MKNQDFNSLLRQHEALVERLVAIAETSSTPTKVLRKLSQLSDSWVVACVSLNPNTSRDVLERLIKTASGVDGTDAETRVHVAGNPALHKKVLERLITIDPSPAVRAAALLALSKRIAAKPNAAASQLWALHKVFVRLGKKASGRASEIKSLLYKHPNFPTKKLGKGKRESGERDGVGS